MIALALILTVLAVSLALNVIYAFAHFEDADRIRGLLLDQRKGDELAITQARRINHLRAELGQRVGAL